MADNSISEQLNEVLGDFSQNQMKFILAMPEYPSKKACAEALEIDPNTVYNWGKKIDIAIDLMQKDIVAAALAIRKKNLVKAMTKKVEGLDFKDVSVRQKAATEIIEWETGKAQQTIDHTSKGEQIGQSDEQLERAISTLSEALGEIISSDNEEGGLDTEE